MYREKSRMLYQTTRRGKAETVKDRVLSGPLSYSARANLSIKTARRP